MSLKQGASPNTEGSLKTLEIVFSAVGKKIPPCVPRKKDVVRKEGAEEEVGGFLESDINSAA